MTKLVFLDTETTGLDSDRHEIWEIGAIERDPADGDLEYLWQIRPDLSTADATGLRIGRYYERCQVKNRLVGGVRRPMHPYNETVSDEIGHDVNEVALELAEMLDGATLVGAVPDFDARFLTRFLRRNGQAPTWHYHLQDCETLIAGFLRGRGDTLPPLPWKSDDLSRLIGVEPPGPAERHTALGDARWVRDMWDRVMAK